MNAQIIRDFLKINNSIIYLKLTQQYCQPSIKKNKQKPSSGGVLWKCSVLFLIKLQASGLQLYF